MTSRERIIAVLKGETPDRVPWVPLIGRYYVKSLAAMGYDIQSFAPKSKEMSPALLKDMNLAEIETIRLTNADILYRHVIAYNLISDTCTYIEKEEENSLLRGWETPLGQLWERVEQHHGTEYISSYMVKTLDDLKKYQYLVESMHPQAAYDDVIAFDKYIADDGLPTLTGPVTPIQQLFQFTMGVENTTYALFDYEEEMQDFFTAQHNLNKEIYTILAQAPAKVVITYEDTSTTVISPQWYEEYESPHLNEYADILSSKGKIHIAHMCGKISLLTQLLAKDRYAAIDSVCPPTTGDIEPKDALSQIGKIIIGGLEPSSLQRMTSEQTYEYTMEKLKQVKASNAFNRFMLSSGDSVAANTPLENLRAVSKAVMDFSIQ